MVRWGYLIPRVVIVGGILLAIGLLLDPVIHRTVVGLAWRTTRTELEIGKLDTRLLKSELDLYDLVLSHRKLSSEKLFEAKRVHFDFDTVSLWRRKFIVDKAYASGMVFDMAREPGDEFEFKPVFKFNKKKKDPSKPQKSLTDISKGILKRELTDKLATWSLLKTYKQEWPGRYDALKKRVEVITASARKLEQESKPNSESSAARVAAAYRSIEAVSKLHQELTTAQQQLTSLSQQAIQHRGELQTAIATDRAFLESQMPLVKLDPEAWSHKLLGERMTGYLKRAAQFAGLFRDNVPSAKNIKKPRKRRGRIIKFHDKETPGLLVRRFLLEGTGRYDGLPFQFSALTRNFSSNPRAVAEPTRMQFKTKGSLVCQGLAEFDLRGDNPRYRLSMDMPPAIAGRYRVKVDDWSLAMSAARTKLRADIILEDDQMRGGIRIVQNQVKFHRDAEGDERLVSMIVDGLQSIKHVDTTITFDGSLTRPKLKLKSTLGPQVAVVMNQAVNQYVEIRKQELIASFNKRVGAELGDLQQIWNGGNEELNGLLKGVYGKLDQLKAKLAAKASPANPILKGVGRFFQR